MKIEIEDMICCKCGAPIDGGIEYEDEIYCFPCAEEYEIL